jgi:hypothetical protein
MMSHDTDDDVTVHKGALDLSRPAKDILMELEEVLANADDGTDAYILLNIENTSGGVSTLILTRLDDDDEIPDSQIH